MKYRVSVLLALSWSFCHEERNDLALIHVSEKASAFSQAKSERRLCQKELLFCAHVKRKSFMHAVTCLKTQLHVLRTLCAACCGIQSVAARLRYKLLTLQSSFEIEDVVQLKLHDVDLS